MVAARSTLTWLACIWLCASVCACDSSDSVAPDRADDAQAVGGSSGSDAGSDAAWAGNGGSSGSAGAESDAATSDPSCPNGYWSLTDDFADGALGSVWQVSESDGLSVSEQQGLLRFVIPAGTLGDAWAGIHSYDSFDLTTACVLLHALTMPSDPEAYVALVVWKEAGYQLEYVVGDGVLAARMYEQDVFVTIKQVSFNATLHAWWRLREQGGYVHWDLSPDGKTWGEPFASLPTPYSVAQMSVAIGVGTNATISQDTDAQFDDFNLPP